MNPNYEGGGRDEYFNYDNDNNGGNFYGYDDDDDGDGNDGNNGSGGTVNNLDCHSPSTEWVLIGVYRQEFYQYVFFSNHCSYIFFS